MYAPCEIFLRQKRAQLERAFQYAIILIRLQRAQFCRRAQARKIFFMHKWYLLYTKVHAERELAGNLTQLGYEVYLPMVPVAHARRDRTAERPFFPGYVFVNYDLEALGLSRLVYTPGLRALVMFGGEPAVVPEQDIVRIRAYLAQERARDKTGTPLRPGDAVEILQEPFAGLDAVFDRTLTPNARVRVFLRYLEQHRLERKSVEHLIPVELDAHLVRKKEAHK